MKLIECKEVGFKEVQISPESKTYSFDSICLDDEFSRVLYFQNETNFEIENLRLKEGDRYQLETKAYCILDVVFYKNDIIKIGDLFAGRRKHRLQSMFSLPGEYDEYSLCSDVMTEKYFGHWLRDGLLMELLAEEIGLPAIVDQKYPWDHSEGYRSLSNLNPEAVRHGRFNKLWVFDDRGLNQGRNDRFHALRARLRVSHNSKERSPELIFMRRGKSGAKRSLVNEDEICKILAKIGFTIIDPEDMTVMDINYHLRNARICILVEGSAHNHYLLNGPEYANILSIQPPDRFNAFCKTFCDSLGWRWGYVVADKVAAGSFYLSPDRLLRTLDLFRV
jgi:hypothetical protein